MRWTEAHSRNAVLKKARINAERIAEFESSAPEKFSAPRLGRFVPDFTINIRSRNGERVQITATRFGKTFITGDGIKSARSISRGIEQLLINYQP